MCQKQEGESNGSYIFRMVCEKPYGIIAVSGWAVALLLGWLYYSEHEDYKAANERQTAAYLEVAKLMSEVKAELQANREHLKKLDSWHQQEFMQGTR